ncbi:hypothetical protein BDF19DRAFT_237451 [Syncephalis fuscata]|nr:hypothetical protein BDF19DRAFT_237451 [Syncephalis fuscata]
MATVAIKFTHRFIEKTYHRWTFCDHCNKVLWGIVKQGLECIECGYICHKRCQDELAFVCDHRLRNHQTDHDFASETSALLFDGGLEMESPSSSHPPTPQPEEIGNNNDRSSPSGNNGDGDDEGGIYSDGDLPLTQSPSSTPANSGRDSIFTTATERSRNASRRYVNNSNASSYTTLVDGQSNTLSSSSSRRSNSRRVTTKTSVDGVRTGSHSSSIIQDLIVSTAANQMAMERSIQPMSLNLVTRTPKNMQRFVQRAGALGSAENTVKYIMTWQSPSTTMLCMVGYALLCLYPILISIIPHLIILNLIISNYFKRAQEIAATRSGKRSPKRQEKHTPFIPLSASSATSVSEYKSNMQYIQNFMGTFADIYDMVAAQLHHLDWSDPIHTANLFKAVFAAIIGTLAVFYIIPVYWIFLAVGEFAFIANTAVVKAFADTVVPVLLERANIKMENAQRFLQKQN